MAISHQVSGGSASSAPGGLNPCEEIPDEETSTEVHLTMSELDCLLETAAERGARRIRQQEARTRGRWIPPLSPSAPASGGMHARSEPRRLRAEAKQTFSRGERPIGSHRNGTYRPFPGMDNNNQQFINMVTELKREVQALNRDRDGTAEEDEMGSPFAPHILAPEIPVSMRLSNPVVYTGDRNARDPRDHINQFLAVMDILSTPDHALCWIFRSTLTGRAQAWFSQLPRGSIRSFDELRELFVRQFACNRRYPKTIGHLMTMVEAEGESLREYMRRFANTVIDVRHVGPHILSEFVAQGTRSVEFANSLVGRPARSLEELMHRAERYMLQEDTRLAKLGIQGHEDRSRNRRGDNTHGRQDMVRRYLEPLPLTPLKISNTEVMNIMGGNQDLRCPPQARNFEAMRHTGKWCLFHRSWGHRTENYDQLKIEIERLLKLGYLRRFIKRMEVYPRNERPGERREESRPREQAQEHCKGGEFDRHSPPHDDPIIIQATIHGAKVSRVLIDTGSSVDVMFLPTFLALGLKIEQIVPETTPLVGFDGSTSETLGSIPLLMSWGRGHLRRTKEIRFWIINALAKTYNVICGRPSLCLFEAVPSVLHLKVKFPANNGIGEVKGNQARARECRLNTMAAIEEGGDINEKNPCEPRRIDTGKFCPAERLKMVEHYIDVRPDAKPVQQKRHKMGPERNKVIKSEIQRLIGLNQIREVQYPEWLANVVLVPKSGGRWRMFIDFTDLNDACPKDCFPLPSIDQLVDSTAGCALLSTMDGNQGYNQIPMAERDQEKTSFITDFGTYCYLVMPFGLKNAGTTYQRLMNAMFSPMIGDNLEVYVDDIVAKCKEASQHNADLIEAFQIMEKFGLKVNLRKCSFGIQGGKFLGFLVTQRGIKVNPEKSKAILDMPPPQTIRDVQRLTGRMASLIRFISKAAEKGLPFFKVLHNVKNFQWSDECQKAFDDLKGYLLCPPPLVKPQQGERLYVYLAVRKEVVSAVLARAEGRDHLPIYYTSRTLKDAKTRYSLIEKFAFALVTTAQKLRSYFLTHPITILTKHPLRAILSHPQESGRMVKWAVELGEYDIHYAPRPAIKPQVLADFMIETNEAPAEEPTADLWKAYVDGSSSSGSGGAGINFKLLREDKPEEVLSFAVKIGFLVSNNEAEYEALLIGMRLAKEKKITRVHFHNDSQLIPRAENEEADTLSRTAAGMHPIDTRQVTFLTVSSSEKGRIALEALNIDKGKGKSWMAEIVAYLQNPEKYEDGGGIGKRAARFFLKEGLLYKKGFSQPYQWCLDEDEAMEVMREIHGGSCGNHSGGRSLGQKILRQGFVVPRILVSDNGIQFTSDQLSKWCDHWKIQHRFTSVGYPQSNGQVEVTNRTLIQGLKARLMTYQGKWVEEIPSLLWAYRTTARASTVETPFSLAYGHEAVILAEISTSSCRIQEYNEGRNKEHVILELDLLEEHRRQAALRSG
uniref:Uncharacterized protein n=1 Tax=Antirrhinum hispanicum TaxID=49039 RepID=Q9AXC3_ANTHI|nr:hypothetical protein [Antirrhinum hispanicum]